MTPRDWPSPRAPGRAGSGVSIDELRHDTPAPGVLRLTLNRPGARNAISLAVQRALDLSLSAAAEDDGVRVVILAGAGSAAFSSGYDLKELEAMTEEEGDAAMLERDELLWRYFTFPKPTVAAVSAVSRGAGTLYAACSDFRVGGPDTDIAVTAAKYGGANLTWLLDGLIGAAHAGDLLMTSRSVLGAEAYRIGLLGRYAEDGDVAGEAVRLAVELAAQPPRALRQIKSLLTEGSGDDRRSRYERENAVSRSEPRPGPISALFASFFDARASR